MTTYWCNDSHNDTWRRGLHYFFLMKECRGWGFWWKSASKSMMHVDYTSSLRKDPKVKHIVEVTYASTGLGHCI